MIELQQTEVFEKRESRLTDKRLRLTIAARLNRLVYGNVGDVRPVGEGVSELRIHYGPGYRIYFQRRGNTVVLLFSCCAVVTRVPSRRTLRLRRNL